MASDQVEHVVEEGNARGNFGFAAAIEVQAQLDLCFFGFAANLCGSKHDRS
jgi:hypothetical protein